MGNYYILPDYVSHHGVLGQKWGVRHGPPYPLSASAHNGVVRSASVKSRKLAAWRNGNATAPSLKTENSKTSNTTVLKKTAKSSGSSSHHQNNSKAGKRSVEDTVKKHGFHPIADLKYRHLAAKNEVDTILSSDTALYRIQSTKDFEKYAYYATYKKHDINEYAGLFGKNLRTRAKTTAKASGYSKAEIEKAGKLPVYQLKIKNSKNIKVASTGHASDVTNNLLKNNKEFRSQFAQAIKEAKPQMRRASQQALFSQAERALGKNPKSLSDKDKRSLYAALNLTLTFHTDNNNKMQNTFYGAMKKKGYGAIVDLNDQKYSSYHAKKPMIIFDTSKSSVASTRTLNEKEISQKYRKYNTERIIKEAGVQTLGNIGLAAKTIKSKVNDVSNKASSGANQVKKVKSVTRKR